MLISVRRKIFFILFLFFFMCVTPLLIAGNKHVMPKVVPHMKDIPKIERNEKIKPGQKTGFKILDTSSGEVLDIDIPEFLYGAVAYEMSPQFHSEALKAQAVATYTYFTRLKEKQILNPEKDLNGAHFKADLSEGEFYVSKQKMKERWKDSYEENFSLIKDAVDKVIGEKIVYKNEPIYAAYHAISGGITEYCKDVFCEDLSYLSSVPSPQDAFAPGYQTIKEVSTDEFKNSIEKLNNEMSFPEDPFSWVKETERTRSGKIKNIKICGQLFSGDQLRSAFSLRSSNFTLDFKDDKFVFTVRGYGHGVGMSQYGAEYMARQGSDYKQILSWYYKGTKIIK